MILVTGAGGTVGSQLVKTLAAEVGVSESGPTVAGCRGIGRHVSTCLAG